MLQSGKKSFTWFHNFCPPRKHSFTCSEGAGRLSRRRNRTAQNRDALQWSSNRDRGLDPETIRNYVFQNTQNLGKSFPWLQDFKWMLAEEARTQTPDSQTQQVCWEQPHLGNTATHQSITNARTRISEALLCSRWWLTPILTLHTQRRDLGALSYKWDVPSLRAHRHVLKRREKNCKSWDGKQFQGNIVIELVVHISTHRDCQEAHGLHRYKPTNSHHWERYLGIKYWALANKIFTTDIW